MSALPPPGREGDPVGPRRLAALGPVGALPSTTLAYETWGEFDGSNAVLVEHALTGDAHAGPDGGWWEGLIGPGRAVDTDRWFVVCPNVLGGCQGSTGPSSTAPDGVAWGSRFPRVGIRDQVDAEALLADALGIGTWAAVLGGSMGGMRALEWAVSRPERVAAVLLLACPAAADADQIAWAAGQLAAIRADPAWRGGDYHGGPHPDAGLGVARRIAHTTYRSAPELAERFGRTRAADGRYAVESYLDHHAAKLVNRFDAGSYVVLTEAMNDHDIGLGRGGVAAALSRVTARAVVAGVDSDRLYPLAQQQELADLIPTADGLHVLTSTAGHDGFLTEIAQLSSLVKRLLG
ncbi:homoserine O-acetyltransferase MetX [Actinokineospora sp. G85]|uniref:homoserine O-acetyltransferase MetX n=1 Tax=Actinokineospora sp. G85 TaxID=3406626 RepID=UPI003C731263